MQKGSDDQGFAIDVDIAPVLGEGTPETLISDTWYLMAHDSSHQSDRLRDKSQRLLQNAMLRAQWKARRMRKRSRRRTTRTPFATRVSVPGGMGVTSSDISAHGMRCSGVPDRGIMKIQFMLPGDPRPIKTQADVRSLNSGRHNSQVGLRFVGLASEERARIERFVQQQADQD